jgi:hypothetical protein
MKKYLFVSNGKIFGHVEDTTPKSHEQPVSISKNGRIRHNYLFQIFKVFHLTHQIDQATNNTEGWE